MREGWRAALGAVVLAAAGCRGADGGAVSAAPLPPPGPECTGTATFGAGCFWCIEAVFQELEGICSVRPGYSGGRMPNPTYEEVCTGETGHAEVAQITYDPKKISYEELLHVFWKTHDPTTLNRQGADAGTQYRSVIFTHDAEQARIARAYKAQLEEAKTFKSPIVTEIVPFTAFYPAERYHENYYRTHPDAGYCLFVIRPKVAKFRKEFKDKLRKS